MSLRGGRAARRRRQPHDRAVGQFAAPNARTAPDELRRSRERDPEGPRRAGRRRERATLLGRCSRPLSAISSAGASASGSRTRRRGYPQQRGSRRGLDLLKLDQLELGRRANHGYVYISPAMKLLVTGGAGYIGSIVSRQLLAPVTRWSCSTTSSAGTARRFRPRRGWWSRTCSIRRRSRERWREGFDGVLHFAALALVGESVSHPERYYRTNVAGTLNLLEAMRDAEVPRLVFSSTCAVYGQPDEVPISGGRAAAPARTPTAPRSSRSTR